MKKFLLSKPLYLQAFGYWLVTTLLHWRLHPTLNIVLYFVGAVIGLHLLDTIEHAVNMQPSPFRTVMGQIVVWLGSIFVMTSSAAVLGQGVALFLNLRLFLAQYKNNTAELWQPWFQLPVIEVTPQTARTYTWFLWGGLIIVSILFVI